MFNENDMIAAMQADIAKAEKENPQIAAMFAGSRAADAARTAQGDQPFVVDHCRDCGGVHHHPKHLWDAGEFFWRCQKCGTKNHG